MPFERDNFMPFERDNFDGETIPFEAACSIHLCLSKYATTNNNLIPTKLRLHSYTGDGVTAASKSPSRLMLVDATSTSAAFRFRLDCGVLPNSSSF